MRANLFVVVTACVANGAMPCSRRFGPNKNSTKINLVHSFILHRLMIKPKNVVYYSIKVGVLQGCHIVQPVVTLIKSVTLFQLQISRIEHFLPGAEIGMEPETRTSVRLNRS